MKKMIITPLAVFGLASCLFAAPAATNSLAAAMSEIAKMTPEERAAKSAENKQKMMELFGGMMEVPGSQKGCIVFANAQKRVPAAELEKVLKFFARNSFAYAAKVVDVEGFTVESAVSIKERIGAQLVVFVVDSPTLGTMLTAPEERWAMVNVAKLAADDPKPQYLSARVRKEATRALAFVASCSQYDAPLVQPMKSPSDLDDVVRIAYPFDVIAGVTKYFNAIGVTKRERSTYRSIITRGYNIAPTNEYQRAIWEKVKAESERKPSNPILITKPKK